MPGRLHKTRGQYDSNHRVFVIDTKDEIKYLPTTKKAGTGIFEREPGFSKAVIGSECYVGNPGGKVLRYMLFSSGWKCTNIDDPEEPEPEPEEPSTDPLQALQEANPGDTVKLTNGSIHIASFMMVGGDLNIAPITLDLNGNTLYVEALFGVAAADGLRIQNGIIDIRDPSAELLVEGTMWLDEVTIKHEHGVIRNIGVLDIDKSIISSSSLTGSCIDTSDGKLDIRASKLSTVSDVSSDISLITGGAGLGYCLITLDNTEITATGTTAITLLDGAELTISETSKISGTGTSVIEIEGFTEVHYLSGTISNDGNGSAINWVDLSASEVSEEFPSPTQMMVDIRSSNGFVLTSNGDEVVPPEYKIVKNNGYNVLTPV